MRKIASKSSGLGKAPDAPRKSDRTRAAILRAAQELFAELGFERTTVRDIATRAKIDPAMVMRYFGSKDALFARATAIDLKLPDLGKFAPGQLGDTLIRHFLEIWEGPSSNGTLTILLRTAASDEDAAAKVRKVFAGQVLPMVTHAADPAEAATRAGLVATQLLGLALCRYILKVPPIVAMSPERIVTCFGPVLQRHIADPIC